MTIAHVNSTSGTGATAQSASSASANPLQSLQNPQTFLNLLVAQLKYQDPLNPTSGTQFLSQTAQLTEVQSMDQLEQEVGLGNVMNEQVVSTSMIGKSVTATLADGTAVSGVVQGVSLDASGPILNVNGTAVPLGDVQTVGTAPSGSGSS